MNKLLSSVLILLLVLFSGCVNVENEYGDASDTIEEKLIRKAERHEGDMVVSEGTKVINNTELMMYGNWIINGTGVLKVIDSEINFMEDYNNEYKVQVNDDGTLYFDNVKIKTNGKWMYFGYGDRSNLTMINTEGVDCCIPWHSFAGDGIATIEKSRVGMNIVNNVTVNVKNSSVFFELIFENSTGVFELPIGRRDRFDLRIPTQFGLIRLNVENSTFTDWGSTLNYFSNITYVNSKVTIGINAGSYWEGPRNPQVRISNLKNGHYDDFTLTVDTNTVRLINTTTRDWYPQAFGNTVMEIEDSDLADLQWSGENAEVTVRNSSMSIAYAKQNVTYYIYDSKIQGDVTAIDDSKIFLYNTEVKGEMREINNGEIFVDGKKINS